MVFYFQPVGFGPGREDYLIYMGKDKYENEDLIKYGLPHDVWFHVDDLSSAHVYLRLPRGGDIKSIPADTLADCAQLVKANSIQGNKINNVSIVYTPWGNLKKLPSMETGQVAFHDLKAVLKVTVQSRSNEIVNRLNRTKKELHPDLAAEREAYDREVRLGRKAETQARKRTEKAAQDEAKREAELRSYKHLMQDDSMVSRSEVAQKYSTPQDYEEDFM